MSRKIADLLIKIGADSYEFKKVTQEVDRGLDDLQKRLESIGKKMSLAITAPLAAIGAVSLYNADIQEKAEAKVQQAIKATGGAAKLTFEQLAGYASELQGKSIFGDEKILNDSTAVLLGFTKVAGNEFKRTQAAALDLATVLGADLKSTTIQLGKALNDPVKNLSALSRMGIQFSKEQTATIRTLAETNRLAEAQGIILDELALKYGGQAEAASKVGLGALQKLKNSWGDFLERIGSMMMPVVTKIANALSGVVDVLNNLDPRMVKIITVIAAIVAAIGPLSLAVGSFLKMLPLLKSGFLALMAPIAGVRTAITALSVAISANPIGLLLTVLSAGVGLFMAFGKSSKDAANETGELTNKIKEESREVNLLVAKLSSSTTAEKDRKEALAELKRIQPDIVDGLNAESVELETLKKRAMEYNQQLVIRLALARKQDQVTAALEKQTEAGIKWADKQAELHDYLVNIGAKLNAGDFMFGRHNPNKGFTEWSKASEQMKSNLIGHYNEIMNSTESLEEKGRRVFLMFSKYGQGGDRIKMDGIKPEKIRTMNGELSKLGQGIEKAGDLVEDAKADVVRLATAFSVDLNNAVGGVTDTTEGLGDAAGAMGKKTQKSISDLKAEIQELEELKSTTTDTAQIKKLNKQIAELQNEINRLNSLGLIMDETKGKIKRLGEEIEAVEKKRQATFDTSQIAQYNQDIAKLREELDFLNKVTPDMLIKWGPVIPPDMKPIEVPMKIKMPDLKSVFAKTYEQMKAIRETVRENIYGWAGEIGAGLRSEIMETEAIVGTYTDALVAKGWNFTQALEFVAAKVGEAMKSFDDMLSQFLAKSVTAAAEAIGQMIAGDLGLDGLMKSILLQFANFLKQIGAQLIEFGILIVAFKSALKSVLANPWAAIAVGAAMVAAAAVMTAVIQKNAKKQTPKLAQGGIAYGPTMALIGDNFDAKVDPEVIAPLSKLRGMMTQGGTANVNVALSGELTAKGRDLAYILGQENYKIDVLGG